MSQPPSTTPTPPVPPGRKAAQPPGRPGNPVVRFFRQPVGVAALIAGLALAGLIVFLELNAEDVELPPPEVSYELLPDEGLVEGLPIMIKVADVGVFKIQDPAAGEGGAERAREIVASIEGAIEELELEAGRVITIDTGGATPVLIQTTIDGSERRVLIEPTPEDVKLSGQSDPKWVTRLWGERLTDALKVYQFGEPPEFTTDSEFGQALTTMQRDALAQQGAISAEALESAYDRLSPSQQAALVAFPAPEPPAPAPAAAKK